MALATDRLIKIDESHSRYSMTEMLSHKLLTKAEESTLSRQYKLGQIIKRQIADLQESLGHKPSDAELEEYLNLTYHDVDHLIQKSERAKHHLISSNMKLVLSIAQRKQHLGLSHPDLVFEGVRGLQKAVEGFDPERGYRFGTYSTLIINQMIHKALDDHSRIVRVPLQFTKICRTVTKEQNDFVEEHGRQPTYEELSEICKLSIHDVKLVFKSLEKILSVESKLVSNKMSTKNQDKGQGQFTS
jgi:RNA polymerase nonessential primary-like sigma factor